MHSLSLAPKSTFSVFLNNLGEKRKDDTNGRAHVVSIGVYTHIEGQHCLIGSVKNRLDIAIGYPGKDKGDVYYLPEKESGVNEFAAKDTVHVHLDQAKGIVQFGRNDSWGPRYHLRMPGRSKLKFKCLVGLPKGSKVTFLSGTYKPHS